MSVVDSPIATSGIFHPAIALDALKPSKTNPRKHFDAMKLDELAASLQEHGVLEPLIVRPNGGAHSYEIVAGERRYRAAKKAGLIDVPVIERELTDDQVLEIQLVENLQRDDLTPLEQARGYKALMDANPDKYTLAAVARTCGMSEAWVWDRLKLNDLIPDAKLLLEDARMSTGHAILIARQKPADQQRILRVDTSAGYNRQHGGLWQSTTATLVETGKPSKYDGVKTVTVRELERWIADHIRFDVAHAAKAMPLQFADTASAIEHAQAQPGRGKKHVPITFSYHVHDDARDQDERTYGVQSWKRADGLNKSKTCEHSILGVVVAGSEGYGTTFQVCIARDKCTVHWATELKAREKNKKLRESGQGKRAAANEHAAEKKRQAEASKEEAQRRRYNVYKPALQKAAQAAAQKLKKLTPAQFKAVLKSFHLPTSTTLATLPKALLLRAIDHDFRESYFWQDRDGKKLETWPKLLGVNVDALEPKSPDKEGEAA